MDVCKRARNVHPKFSGIHEMYVHIGRSDNEFSGFYTVEDLNGHLESGNSIKYLCEQVPE